MLTELNDKTKGVLGGKPYVICKLIMLLKQETKSKRNQMTFQKESNDISKGVKLYS